MQFETIGLLLGTNIQKFRVLQLIWYVFKLQVIDLFLTFRLFSVLCKVF
jgi:hypothetical protein